MGDQEIIELESSGDEASVPTPKRAKRNVMVHIPEKGHSLPKGSSSRIKSATYTKASNFAANTREINFNGRYTQNYTSDVSHNRILYNRPGALRKKLHFNPMALMPRDPVIIKHRDHSSKFTKPEVSAKEKILGKLPSSITIKSIQGANKNTHSTGVFGPVKFRSNNKFTRNQFLGVKIPDEIGKTVTEEFDDDNSQTRSATHSSLWYLRPEEQETSNNLREESNRKHEPHNFIEITIEDSPVKQHLSKETNINEGNFIIIEDSPTKSLDEVISKDTEEVRTKSRHSRKRLNYPESSGSMMEQCETAIIKIDAISNKFNEEEKSKCKTRKLENNCDNPKGADSNQQDQEVGNEAQVCNVNVIEKLAQNNRLDDKAIKSIDENSENSLSIGEFHPIVQKFIALCCEIDKTEDMKKIVEKRIKKYYQQVSKVYVESEEFLDLVSKKIVMIEADPTKIYLYLKDVVDELNLQRKMAKPCQPKNPQNIAEGNVYADNHNDRHNNKRERQIHKLEKTIKTLNRAIKKLEEQEVDFDDEEDSVYLLTERYKERLVRVYEKFCKMSKIKMPSEPQILIQSRPGQPPGPARKLMKLINKKVRIGNPLIFPDFHDVLKCVREANVEDRLGWNEAEIIDEARDLFSRCGKKLQKRRQENEWRLAASYVTESVDPAEKDEALKIKLDENKNLAVRRETEIINKYAARQNQLHLEAIEISDNEADASPVESEEEELHDNHNSLDDGQKRKDCLRRLLNETSMEKKEESCNVIKEATSTNSMSTVNKDDSEKSKNEEKITAVECSKTGKKPDIQEVTKSMEFIKMKYMVNEEQHEGNKHFKENGSYRTHSNKIETEISNGFTAGGLPVKCKSKVDDNVFPISYDSEADELNLLQRLHSGSEGTECSEYVVVSETNSESEDFDGNDVISIEDSSYSETGLSENDSTTDNGTMNMDVDDPYNTTYTVRNVNVADTSIDMKMTNNCHENIFLASSEDECNSLKGDKPNINDTMTVDVANDKISDVSSSQEYVNLNDEEITISETFIGEIKCPDYVTEITSNYNENILLAPLEVEAKTSKDDDQFENDRKKVKGDEISINDSMIIDGANTKISDVNSGQEHVNLSNEEITISEAFEGRIKCQNDMGIVREEHIKEIEEKDDNEVINSDDKPSEKESENVDINNIIPDINDCTGSVNCNENKQSPNNINTCNENASKQIIYKTNEEKEIADTTENLGTDNGELDESEPEMSQVNDNIMKDVNVCDTQLHIGVVQTQSEVKNHKITDGTQSEPREEISNNMDNSGGTDDYNTVNVTTTNPCIPLAEKSVVVPDADDIEMLLEKMFNPGNG